ncbi:hypothetical protein PoB_005111100 [Plakobranchus ocellatus]|uniref:Uncharacterized protein n=1 Tax=Plakobranchus ocellatus TaxID=259542 RepID=A0AAV4BVQ5_9GAST|nr:hypothetical protein PoB_005111100 [Plakobranchus ocellatus]
MKIQAFESNSHYKQFVLEVAKLKNGSQLLSIPHVNGRRVRCRDIVQDFISCCTALVCARFFIEPLVWITSLLSRDGKFEGKRSRGRQREKIMDGLATWPGPGKVSDILAAVKDRNLWRDMIANAYKQGT